MKQLLNLCTYHQIVESTVESGGSDENTVRVDRQTVGLKYSFRKSVLNPKAKTKRQLLLSNNKNGPTRNHRGKNKLVLAYPYVAAVFAILFFLTIFFIYIHTNVYRASSHWLYIYGRTTKPILSLQQWSIL